MKGWGFNTIETKHIIQIHQLLGHFLKVGITFLPANAGPVQTSIAELLQYTKCYCAAYIILV